MLHLHRLATLIALLLAGPYCAFCAELDSEWANRHVGRLLGNPYVPLCHSFQFEWHAFDESKNPPRHWRLVVEQIQSRDHAAATSGLFLIDEQSRTPLLHLNEHGGITLLEPDSAPGQLGVPDVWLRWDRFERVREFEFQAGGHFLLTFDFEKILYDILAQPAYSNSCRVDRLARVVTVSADKADVELRFTRERRPREFSLVSLHYKPTPSVSGGLPPVGPRKETRPSILLTNFYTSPRRASDVTARNISQPAPSPVAPIDATDKPVVSAEWLNDKLQWLCDEDNLQRVVASPRVQAAGRELLARLRPPEALTDDETTRVERALARIEAERIKPTSAIDGQQCREPLADLATLLGERIVEPVRIERRAAAPAPCYVAGHERWKTAAMLEARAGPELTARIYDALGSLAATRVMPLDVRLAALDLLGEVGLPVWSMRLGEIEADLNEVGDTAPAVRAMLSAVNVRTGRPIKEDVERLTMALDDPASPALLRGACLEALMLLDETFGRQAQIHEMVIQPAERPLDLPTRCLFAAGISAEGRRVLASVIRDRSPERLFQPALFLAETSIHPGDEPWEDVQEVVERLALDEQADVELRLKCAQIAAQSVERHRFRDAYIRAALRSGHRKLIAALSNDYLKRHGAQRYANEFLVALQSPDTAVRIAAARSFSHNCNRRWLPDEQAGVVAVVEAMLDSELPAVKRCAPDLLPALKRAGWADADDRLLRLVEAARSEPDNVEFIGLVYELKHSSLVPFEANEVWLGFYQHSNGRRRTPEETSALVAAHRADIERQLDAWLETRRPKAPSGEPDR